MFPDMQLEETPPGAVELNAQSHDYRWQGRSCRTVSVSGDGGRVH
jgi:hypothetical protein